MKKIFILVLCPLLFSTVGIIGCANYNILNVWNPNADKHLLFKKVMVVGMMKFKEFENQAIFENAFVKQLHRIGVPAVAYTSLFGSNDKIIGDSNISDLKMSIRNKNIDGVITITLLDKDKEKEYIQPTYTGYGPYGWGGWGGGWGGGFGYGWGGWGGYYLGYSPPLLISPGYIENVTNYYYEVNLFDINSDSIPLYSCQSVSYQPNSLQGMANNQATLVISNMHDNHVFAKKRYTTQRNRNN
ncbi:MAG: hypothetical protein QM528_00775 [Phycisphaerales bacterium]|nr:hypothetical protein [Phycisphaerales bacterium]